MASRNKSNQMAPARILLSISNQEFQTKLSERISSGEELLQRDINSEADYEKLNSDYKIWNEYNFEYLKQAFNNPQNEYLNSYNEAGYSFFGQEGEGNDNPVIARLNLVKYKLENLKSLLAKSELIKSEALTTPITKAIQKKISRKEVFIVHGHDELAKTKAARLIQQLDLKPIILHEQTNSGKTIIEKIEEYSNVGFGIVLYTPCDKGCIKGQESALSNRARQNVVFEHGYLIGKIGRNNVSALVKGDVEVPNDISGVVYIKMDDDDSWQLKIAKELRSAGYEIDLNKL